MPYLLMPIFLNSFIAKLIEKTIAESAYFRNILIKDLFYSKTADIEVWEGYIAGFKIFKAVICITNVSKFLSRAVTVNLYLSINSICLVVGKILVIM